MKKEDIKQVFTEYYKGYNNVITPRPVNFYKIGDYYIEMSIGEIFDHTLYAATILKHDKKIDEVVSTELSKCFTSSGGSLDERTEAWGDLENYLKTLDHRHKLKSITVKYAEGSGIYDGKKYGSWDEFTNLLHILYSKEVKDRIPGYTKVHMLIEWEDDIELEWRVDVGVNSWTPARDVGEYIRDGLVNPHHKVKGDSIDHDFLVWKDRIIS